MDKIFSFVGAYITFVGAVGGIVSGNITFFLLGIINVMGFVFFMKEIITQSKRKLK